METDLAGSSLVRKMPTWLRWIAFLPAAFMGSVLASGFYRLSYSLFAGPETGFFSDLASSAILGGTFVYFAASVAPKYQFEISVVFLVLATIFSVFSVLASAQPYSSIGLGLGLLHGLVVLIAAGGTVIAIYKQRREESGSAN